MTKPNLRLVQSPVSASLAELQAAGRQVADGLINDLIADMEALEARAREIAGGNSAFFPVGIMSQANTLANQLRDRHEGIEAIRGRA